MTTLIDSEITASIWIGSFHAYNTAEHYVDTGKWYTLEDWSDIDDIIEDYREHVESVVGAAAPEYLEEIWCFDIEGDLKREEKSPWEAWKEYEHLVDLVDEFNGDKEAMLVAAAEGMDAESYRGRYEDAEDYFYEYVDGTGEVPDHLLSYIDIDAWMRDNGPYMVRSNGSWFAFDR